MNLILLGAPGSGKGTQGKLLVDNFKFTHLSTGDLLRKEIAKKTPLGQTIDRTVKMGHLVSDDIVLELLKKNLNLEESYIFDGYPRTLDQALSLDELIGKLPYKAIYFDLSFTKIKDRIIHRRTCVNCKAIFHLKSLPPKTKNECDYCGHELELRHDDSEEVVKERLSIFKKTVGPILKFYEEKNALVRIDASASKNLIYESVINSLDL